MTEQEFFRKLGIETSLSKVLLSGYRVLDELIGGGFSSEIVTVASRPGHGKTSLLFNLMMNFSMKQEFKGIVAFPRMTERDFVLSVTSWLTNLNVFDKELTDETLLEVYPKYKDLISKRVKVLHRMLTLEEIFTLAEVRNADYVILDDYFRSYQWHYDLEKFPAVFEKIQEFINKTQIPVFVSILTTRSAEKRGGDMCPRIGDIYRSDLVSTYSHKVIQLYRPSEYGISMDEFGFPTDGNLDLMLQQNSQGKTGSVRLFYSAPRKISEDSIGQ